MTDDGVPLEKPLLREMYLKMVQTRCFEETAARLFTEGKVHGTAHFCIGEEATGIGACCALEPEDLIYATHRGHGQSIGKGMDIRRMMAEFLGKELADFAPTSFRVVDDPLYAGVDGALELAKDMPEEYWENM